MLNDVRGYPPERSNPRPGSRRTPTTTTATPTQPRRRSLFSYSPVAGTLLLVTGVASGSLLSLFLGLYPLRDTTGIALSLLFSAAWCTALVVPLFHPSIRPPPRSPGKSVFFYFLTWISAQAPGFVVIHSLWARGWPDHRKNWAVAWMLLSLTTVALWTYALITTLGRRSRGRGEAGDPEAGRAETGPEASKAMPASRDDAVHVEHIEFSEPPSAYFVIRVREKDDEPKA